MLRIQLLAVLALLVAMPLATHAQVPESELVLELRSVEVPALLVPGLEIAILNVPWQIVCPSQVPPVGQSEQGTISWRFESHPDLIIEGNLEETIRLPDCVQETSLEGSTKFNLLVAGDAVALEPLQATVYGVVTYGVATGSASSNEAAATFTTSGTYRGQIALQVVNRVVQLDAPEVSVVATLTNFGNGPTQVDVALEGGSGAGLILAPAIHLPGPRDGNQTRTETILTVIVADFGCIERAVTLSLTPRSATDASLEGPPVQANLRIGPGTACASEKEDPLSKDAPGTPFAILALALVGCARFRAKD